MSTITVQSSRTLAATADAVYAFLRDYRTTHPRILTSNFLDYAVEEGGEGAGTVIRYRFKAAGRERPYRMRIDEPAPGRALRESDADSSLVTTWTLSPIGENQTAVAIKSTWQGGSGIGGFMERTFAPMGLRRVYRTMLANLEQSLSRGA